MKGYRFDPALLASQQADPTVDPYRAAGQMLRDYLGGGDIFAEVRERVRRDPQLRAMLAVVSEMIGSPAEHPRPLDGRRTRRQRRSR